MRPDWFEKPFYSLFLKRVMTCTAPYRLSRETSIKKGELHLKVVTVTMFTIAESTYNRT